MLMSSSVASCSTSCRKGSAASVTSAFWRTPAALPSFQPSALLCKRRSRDPLLNPPIIASATQSSPVIVSIFAQSVVAPWSRSAFGRARHRGDPQRRAVTPHDDQPRTPFFAHLHADAPRRNVDPCPQNLARILASLICCQNTCDRPRTRNRPISSSSQFAHGSTVRANNPLSNRRRRARTPISPDQQHAASFNPASNRSRAELAAGCVTRGLFEPSSIPPDPHVDYAIKCSVIFNNGSPRLGAEMTQRHRHQSSNEAVRCGLGVAIGAFGLDCLVAEENPRLGCPYTCGQ